MRKNEKYVTLLLAVRTIICVVTMCCPLASLESSTTYGLRSFSYFSAKQWNALPEELRKSTFFSDNFQETCTRPGYYCPVKQIVTSFRGLIFIYRFGIVLFVLTFFISRGYNWLIL